MNYPQSCMSMFCGKVLCDGCVHRPTHAKYYASRGELAEFEAGQTVTRTVTRKAYELMKSDSNLSYGDAYKLAKEWMSTQ